MKCNRLGLLAGSYPVFFLSGFKPIAPGLPLRPPGTT
jgi:hypothetical protein